MTQAIDIFSIYYPTDPCSCYFPNIEPPESFLEECRRYWERWDIFRGNTEKKIGNTRYIIETACSGTERLGDKLKRLIFSDKEENNP